MDEARLGSQFSPAKRERQFLDPTPCLWVVDLEVTTCSRNAAKMRHKHKRWLQIIVRLQKRMHDHCWPTWRKGVETQDSSNNRREPALSKLQERYLLHPPCTGYVYPGKTPA